MTIFWLKSNSYLNELDCDGRLTDAAPADHDQLYRGHSNYKNFYFNLNGFSSFFFFPLNQLHSHWAGRFRFGQASRKREWEREGERRRKRGKEKERERESEEERSLQTHMGGGRIARTVGYEGVHVVTCIYSAFKKLMHSVVNTYNNINWVPYSNSLCVLDYRQPQTKQLGEEILLQFQRYCFPP